MYTQSSSFTVAVLLTSMFVVSVSAQPGPDCTRTSDKVDTSTLDTVCFLPGNREQIFPSDNHRTCYRTCIKESQSGPFSDLDCCANYTDENNTRIEILAPKGSEQQDNYNLRIVQSPNFLANRDYSGSTICRYNVQCRQGQLLHYLVTDHTLQGPEVDPPNMPTPECVDFLDIDRSAYSSGLVTRTCGGLATFESDSSDFNLDRTSVLFQTNRRSENIGFFMVVTCVNPEFYNLDGCTQAQTGQTVAPPRSKRETEMEEMFKIRDKRFGFRVPCIKVPTDAAVSYENSIVRVVRGDVTLYRFPGIRVFHVFNRAERFLVFYGSAGGRVFPGFGKLQIGSGKAFFIQEGVKSQFRLSELEEQVFRQLWNALLTQTSLLASEDFSVDDALDVGPPGLRGRPGTQPIDIDQLIEDNMNACNGVLRATACAIREIKLNKTCEVP